MQIVEYNFQIIYLKRYIYIYEVYWNNFQTNGVSKFILSVRSHRYLKISRQIRRAYQILVPERSLLHYRRRNFHSLQFEKSDGSLFFLRIREIRRVVDHQFTMISFFEMKIVRKKEKEKKKKKRRKKNRTLKDIIVG